MARDAPTSVESNGVAAVDRALAIVSAFASDGKPLTLAELAARTGMHKSTIVRLGYSLLKQRYLQKLDDGRYQIGPTFFLVGAIYQRSLKVSDVVMPLLHRLGEKTQESCSFYIIHNGMRVCLHRVDSPHEIREIVFPGDVLPLSGGSGGLVLGAFSGARGERFDKIRSAYYYISLGERHAESAGIAAPVFGTGQRLLGAIAMSGPITRVNQEVLRRLRGDILKTAAHATRALGGDWQPLEAAVTKLSIRKSSPATAPTA